MSRLSEISYNIQELYIEGHSARTISMMLECSIEDVLSYLEEINVADSPQHYSEEYYNNLDY